MVKRQLADSFTRLQFDRAHARERDAALRNRARTANFARAKRKMVKRQLADSFTRLPTTVYCIPSYRNAFLCILEFTIFCCVIIFWTTIHVRKVVHMKELREIIRDLREDRDLKQKTIANYLGISQQTYSNYENGHREIPTWVVVALAQYYKVSTDYLLGTDTSYLGNTNLKNPYLENITMHDIIYDIQKLKRNERRDLIKYIRFLKHSDNT